MKKFLLASALALGTASVLSGCFVFTGVKLSDTKLKPGERSVMKVNTRPFDRDPASDDRDYPFVFVRIDGQGVHAANPKRFDVKGSFTRNGLSLRRDDDLRTFILDTYSECGPIDTTDSENLYRAFVTSRQVNDRQLPQTQAISTLGIRQTSLSDSTGVAIGVAVGGADGDNDGIYEGSDTACLGGAVTSLYVKPEPGTRPPTRADAREFHERINGR